MNIILAQLNLLVGDIPNNTKNIITSIKDSVDKYNADIILFPELSISSYPPEDVLFRSAFHNYIQIALDEIVKSTGNVYVLLGYPYKDGKHIYNSCSLIHQGRIVDTYHKQYLPNYGVFDEKRYFTQGTDTCLFEINNVKAAISICEDIWVKDPAKNAADSGAKIIFNINASPFHKNKLIEREQIIKTRAKETGMFIVYSNLVGGQDELVFDGNSMIVDNKGNTIFHAPGFKEGLYHFELQIEKQNEPVKRNNLVEEESIYNALVTGVRDYIYKNKFNGAVIGLSGGIDSALTLCVAVDAIGAENVEVLVMPSRFTADISIEDAKQQANNLNVAYEVISIEKPFDTFLELLEPRFHGLSPDITEENIQARIRGLLLMAVSNKSGRLVLTTGNKSEMAVGYATLYGDMAGGFAPLKDIWKTMAYKLARWRNTQKIIIPERVIERPPSAELREDQQDIDSLPDYETLDPILEQYIEKDMSPDLIIKNGFNSETVYKVVNLVDRNEYKRRQAAPGVRITQRAFGRDRRYPITSGYKEGR